MERSWLNPAAGMVVRRAVVSPAGKSAIIAQNAGAPRTGHQWCCEASRAKKPAPACAAVDFLDGRSDFGVKDEPDVSFPQTPLMTCSMR
jgi:hypothetical protein